MIYPIQSNIYIKQCSIRFQKESTLLHFKVELLAFFNWAGNCNMFIFFVVWYFQPLCWHSVGRQCLSYLLIGDLFCFITSNFFILLLAFQWGKTGRLFCCNFDVFLHFFNHCQHSTAQFNQFPHFLHGNLFCVEILTEKFFILSPAFVCSVDPCCGWSIQISS